MLKLNVVVFLFFAKGVTLFGVVVGDVVETVDEVESRNDVVLGHAGVAGEDALKRIVERVFFVIILQIGNNWVIVRDASISEETLVFDKALMDAVFAPVFVRFGSNTGRAGSPREVFEIGGGGDDIRNVTDNRD